MFTLRRITRDYTSNPQVSGRRDLDRGSLVKQLRQQLDLRAKSAEQIETLVLIGASDLGAYAALQHWLPKIQRVAIFEPRRSALESLAAAAASSDGQRLQRRTWVHTEVGHEQLGLMRFLAKQRCSHQGVAVIIDPDAASHEDHRRCHRELVDVIHDNGREFARHWLACPPAKRPLADTAYADLFDDYVNNALRHEQWLSALIFEQLRLSLGLDRLQHRLQDIWRSFRVVDAIAVAENDRPPHSPTLHTPERTQLRHEARAERLAQNLAHIGRNNADQAEQLRGLSPAPLLVLQLEDEPWLLEHSNAKHPILRAPRSVPLVETAGVWLPVLTGGALSQLDDFLQGISRVEDIHACIGSVEALETLINLRRNGLVSSRKQLRQKLFFVAERIQLLRSFLEFYDFRQLLDPPDVEIFLGHDADDQLIQRLRNQVRQPCPYFRVGLSPRLTTGLAELRSTRSQNCQRNTLALKQHYSVARLSEAHERLQRGDPLTWRIVCSNRTEVLKYIAGELMTELRSLGHTCHISTEIDAYEYLSHESVLADLTSTPPDILVLLDRIRPQCPPLAGLKLPVVSWIIDELPELAAREHIDQLGALDFVFCWSKSLAIHYDRLGYTLPGVLRFAAGRSFQNQSPVDTEASIALITHLERPRDPTWAPGIMAALRSELAHEAINLRGGKPVHAMADSWLNRQGIHPPSESARAQLHYQCLLALRHFDRIDFAQQLLTANIPLVLYGHGWSELPEFAEQSRGPIEDRYELGRCYARHRAVLHINHRCNLHPRVLECIAAGGLILARSDEGQEHPEEAIDNFFEPGQEICLFRDQDELVAFIRRALEDDDWRQQLIDRGRRRVLSEHGFQHRVQTLLAAVEGKITSALAVLTPDAQRVAG